MKNRKGFTLIEIIAVLVILGVLAAVAVPKFVDLQADAKQKAAEGALAAAMSACSLTFAQAMLAGDPFTCANAEKNVETSSYGDKLKLEFADDGGNCTLTATYEDKVVTAVWKNPANK